ncbi:MAG: 16S rRNA (guanine(527)-N(7))-methyltransferase RsmG [Bacilli bacterium]|nr:16S rRNA (guanine(527)-N(7))-methyltransferase RsmG [Bacilli bacterium]
MNINSFYDEVKKLDINLTKTQMDMLEKYYELLVTENEKINLTTITEEEDVYLKHFYDSLTLIKAYNLRKEATLCDIGTGAGFPGVVLAICFPNLKVTVVESIRKKIDFLFLVKKELDLKNIFICNERAEIFARNNIEKYDIVTSRAMARLNILNEMCIPLVKVNGYFIPMKANLDEELEEAKSSIEIMNSKLEEVITFNLPVENSIRNLVVIKKLGNNKKRYPRDYKQIKNMPL